LTGELREDKIFASHRFASRVSVWRRT
jgi:hypothetical protein